MTVTRCFTFGSDHFKPLGAFVRITSASAEECRAQMFLRYGKAWAFEYSEEQIGEQKGRFPLYEVGAEEFAAENNIILKADNTCTTLGPVACHVLLRYRSGLSDIHESGSHQSAIDAKIDPRGLKTTPRNRWFCIDGYFGNIKAASPNRQSAVNFMRHGDCLLERQTEHDFLQESVELLERSLPGITFGYLGNCESWGDDRSWYVFLPHPGRVGTFNDAVSLGYTAKLYEQVKQWPAIEAAARRLYHNGSVRVEGGAA